MPLGAPSFSLFFNHLSEISVIDPETISPRVCWGSRWMPHEMGVEVGGGAVNLKKRTLKFQERGVRCRPRLCDNTTRNDPVAIYPSFSQEYIPERDLI